MTHPRYPAAVELMIDETNAAIEGALAGGGDEILVNDSHGSMYNLLPSRIHPAARLLQGQKPWSMVEGAGPGAGFGVALFVGYHARAGHPRGTIAHTYSGAPVETRLDGRPTGEYGLNALALGAWEVPVGLVAGDDALAEEVEAWLPWAERVVVKTAAGGHAAASLHPTVAADLVRAGAERAVRRAAAGELELLRVGPPVVIEVDYRRGCRGRSRRDRAGRGAGRRPRRALRRRRSDRRVSRLPGREPAGRLGRPVRAAMARAAVRGPTGDAVTPYCPA